MWGGGRGGASFVGFLLTFQRGAQPRAGYYVATPAATHTNTEHMVAICDGQVELDKLHGSQQSRWTNKQDATGTSVKNEGGQGC